MGGGASAEKKSLSLADTVTSAGQADVKEALLAIRPEVRAKLQAALQELSCAAVVFVFAETVEEPKLACDSIAKTHGWTHIPNDDGINSLVEKIRSVPQAGPPWYGSRVVVSSAPISITELEEFEASCRTVTFAVMVEPNDDTDMDAQRSYFHSMAPVAKALEVEDGLLHYSRPDSEDILTNDLVDTVGAFVTIFESDVDTSSGNFEATVVDLALARARAQIVISAFDRVADEGDGGKKEVSLDKAVELLKPMALPHGRKAKKELAKYDKSGNGTIDIDELHQYLDKAIKDNLEASSAITLANFYQKTQEFDENLTADADHDPTLLPGKLMKIIEMNSEGLEAVKAADDEQTANVQAILSKVSNDLLNPSPLADRTCKNFLLDTCTRKPAGSWAWRCSEFAKEQPFSEYTSGSVPGDTKAALEQGSDKLIEASKKFGPKFDETMELFVKNLTSWKEEVVDEAGIQALEEPCIMAFSFGTGDKIGPATSLPTLVGPGCETPGLMNCGLALQIKKILDVRPMPVYSQWEIADALIHGEKGCPEEMHNSFFEWDFDDPLPDGEPEGLGGTMYPRIAKYTTSSGEEVPVYKALPIWPKAVEDGLVKQAALGEQKTIAKFYLSTAGVLEQFDNIWKYEIDKKPKTAIIVGHPDHRRRCQMNVELLAMPQEDGSLKKLNVEKLVMPAESFYGDWGEYRCDPFGYDPTSTQPWTTTRPFYIAHEVCCRNMAFMRGDFGPLPFQCAVKQQVQANVAASLGKGSMLSLLAPNDFFDLDDVEKKPKKLREKL